MSGLELATPLTNLSGSTRRDEATTASSWLAGFAPGYDETCFELDHLTQLGTCTRRSSAISSSWLRILVATTRARRLRRLETTPYMQQGGRNGLQFFFHQ